MTVPSVAIRPLSAADAETIEAMDNEFADYLEKLGDTSSSAFDAAAYLRDGFGPDPAFAGILAELDGHAVGYLLYHFGYDVDQAMRILHVIDLFVREAARGQGVGEALMRAAAAICQQGGGRELFWSVYAPNRAAIVFYERLGACFIEDTRFMRWPVPLQD